MENYFVELNNINVSDKTEKKNGLTYLSWAWAWGELKKKHPDSTYKIYENKDEWNYFTDGKTCWVKVSVTVNGLEHIEMLPVMDFRNQSIHLDKVTSFDVNKAIQRALTKAIGRHGLGLYIYAGEDLPEEDTEKKPTPKESKPIDRDSVRDLKIMTITEGKNITLSQADVWMSKKYNTTIKDATEEQFGALCEALKGYAPK